MSEIITPLIQDYIVDFASNNNFFFAKGVQGDGYGVRYARIALSNNGQPYTIDEDAVRVLIMGTKPDTKEIFNTCEIVDSSTIQFEITQQMLAVPGKGEYSIVIASTTTNQMLKSFPFYIISNQSSFDASYITSSNEFTILISKINQVDKLSNDVETLVEEAQLVLRSCEEKTEEYIEAIAKANDTISDLRTLEESITSAESSRVEAENLRQTNTATAIANIEKATEDTISATNDADIATKNANDAATIARQAIEDIQDTLGIDDTSESPVTTWSSQYIREQLNLSYRYRISNITIHKSDWLNNSVYIENRYFTPDSVIDIYYNHSSIYHVEDFEISYSQGNGWLKLTANYEPYSDIVIDAIMIENYYNKTLSSSINGTVDETLFKPIVIENSDFEFGYKLDDFGSETSKENAGVSNYIDISKVSKIQVEFSSLNVLKGAAIVEYDENKIFVRRTVIYDINGVVENNYNININLSSVSAYIRISVNELNDTYCTILENESSNTDN